MHIEALGIVVCDESDAIMSNDFQSEFESALHKQARCSIFNFQIVHSPDLKFSDLAWPTCTTPANAVAPHRALCISLCLSSSHDWDNEIAARSPTVVRTSSPRNHSNIAPVALHFNGTLCLFRQGGCPSRLHDTRSQLTTTVRWPCGTRHRKSTRGRDVQSRHDSSRTSPDPCESPCTHTLSRPLMISRGH